MNDLNLRIPPEVMQYYVTEFIPNWHVVMEGPVPFGQLEPLRLSMSDVILGTAEDAEEHMREHIRLLCEQVWDRTYDEDDWKLTFARISNGN